MDEEHNRGGILDDPLRRQLDRFRDVDSEARRALTQQVRLCWLFIVTSCEDATIMAIAMAIGQEGARTLRRLEVRQGRTRLARTPVSILESRRAEVHLNAK